MPDKQSRGASGSVGKPRPRIHNKKLLAAIHAAVMEHSGNGELADHVVEHISAESVIGGNDDQSTPQVPPNPEKPLFFNQTPAASDGVTVHHRKPVT